MATSYLYGHDKDDYAPILESYGLDELNVLVLKCTAAMLCMLGIIANIFSIAIWQKSKFSFSSYLVAIAICDLVILLCSVAWFCVDTFFNSSGDFISNFVFPIISFCAYPMQGIAQSAASFMSLIVSIKLHSAVLRPSAQHSTNSKSKCRKFRQYAFAVFILSVLHNCFKFFERQIVAIEDSSGNTISFRTKPTGMSLSRHPLYYGFNILYNGWLHLTVDSVVPLTVIAVLNAAVVIELRTANSRRIGPTYLQMKERNRYKMMLYISFEFLVCSAVGMIEKIVYLLRLDFEQQLNYHLMVMLPLSTLFDAINSSSNFVTYLAFCEEFRGGLYDLLCCRKHDRQEGLRSVASKRVLMYYQHREQEHRF